MTKAKEPVRHHRIPHANGARHHHPLAAHAGAISAPASGPEPFSDPSLYMNRELSLLAFQRRVLEEALDPENRLLERVKFLGIVESNLDEFFMVRVAGLKQQVAAGVSEFFEDDRTPAQQLAAIRPAALELMTEARRCLHNELLPALREQGVTLFPYADLPPKHKLYLAKYFDETVFPVLTPLAFDPGRPFPYMSNLSMNLAVLIRGQDGFERFARVKVPKGLPRLVPLPAAGPPEAARKPYEFVWLEDVISAHIERLFPGMEIIAVHPFRIVRNADMEIQELEAEDLLETVEEGVRRRRFGAVVRLTVNTNMPADLVELLCQNLNIEAADVYRLEGPMGLSALMALYGLDRWDLKDPPIKPQIPPAVDRETREDTIFAAIRRENVLLHHPFDSFLPVVEFLTEAARDPDVLAIKQTLYRTGRDSPIIDALLEARENDKEVAVLVELKARFDEESNIGWARALEREGVHVIYGLPGLKTHCKVALAVRREGDTIRRYVHLSTGNYNAVTAYQYTDIGLFTCDEAIGADASDLFNYLTGYSTKRDYRKLLVAPIALRQQLEHLIRREIEFAANGAPAHMIFKMNALVDLRIIKLLYEASGAGVKIDLIVRGTCCLLPGLPGVSENITVRSHVGRFLEHSRIFYFASGGEEAVYLGSADLMPRNLNRRVEVLFPVEDKKLIKVIRGTILSAYLADNVKARQMAPDGTFIRLRPRPGEPPINAQETFARLRSPLSRPGL